MVTQILCCPACKRQFRFEWEGKLPDSVTCPKCGEMRSSGEFSSLMCCPECHASLEIPAELMNEEKLVCPQCDHSFRPQASSLLDDEEEVFELKPKKPSTMFHEGERFDKYEIIRLLGKGGMAEVYLAEHVLLGQEYALKVMKPELEDRNPLSVKRFIREAKLTHRISHPNIVSVSDVGYDQKTGYIFIAMEYVQGKSLLEVCRERKVEEKELLEIALSMTSALKELEKQKIVHRDIKPSNIMMCNDGSLKLMDLGIAKSESSKEDMTLTMDQTAIGTPSYASPEQCKSAHNVDIRSDIYCLGATLYHIASGTVPFEGGTPVEVMLKVMREDPKPILELRPDFSLRTAELIGKMMRKEPSERPANVAELEEMIRNCISMKDAPHAKPSLKLKEQEPEDAPVPRFRGKISVPAETPASAPAPAPAARSVSAEEETIMISGSEFSEKKHQALPVPSAEEIAAGKEILSGLGRKRIRVRRFSLKNWRSVLVKIRNGIWRTVFLSVVGVLVAIVLVILISVLFAWFSFREDLRKAALSVTEKDGEKMLRIISENEGWKQRRLIHECTEKILETKNGDLLELLISNGFLAGKGDETPWLNQAGTSEGLWITQALIKSKRGVNLRLNDGSSLLEKAIASKDYAHVDFLLNNGADPNSPTSSGMPLIFVTVNEPQVLAMMLKAGAKTNVRDWNMNTPLMSALSVNNGKSVSMLLNGATSLEQENLQKETPLLVYMKGKEWNGKGVESLLKYPCNVNAVSRKGRNALDIALKAERYRTSYCLIAAGAKPPSDLISRIKDPSLVSNFEKLLKRLERNPAVEAKSTTPWVDDVVPPYNSGKPVILWIRKVLALAVWLLLSLFCLKTYCTADDSLKKQYCNLLYLIAGPIPLLYSALQVICRQVMQKIFFWYTKLPKNEVAVHFYSSDGRECKAEEGGEGIRELLLGCGIFHQMFRKKADRLLLRPSGHKYSVIFDLGGKEKVVMELNMDTGRKLINLFKVLSGLNCYEEVKPQEGEFQLHYHSICYKASLSTVGLGSSGERALIRLNAFQSKPEVFRQLAFTSEGKRCMEKFIATGKGLLVVTGASGSGRRTFVSLLLEEFAKKFGTAIWIGDGTEPATSDNVPCLKADPGNEMGVAQLLSALPDYRAAALTVHENDFKVLPELIKLSERKVIILFADYSQEEFLKNFAGQGFPEELLAEKVSLTVQPLLFRKLCDCASPVVPKEDLFPVFLAAGIQSVSARNPEGCSSCAQTGFSGKFFIYDVWKPSSGKVFPGKFPTWTPGRVAACHLAADGAIGLKDLDGLLDRKENQND